MRNFKSYISILFLALLLFPLAEKGLHLLEHDHDELCNTKGLHFCNLEHSCHVCDYVFSASSTPPNNQNRVNIVPPLADYSILFVVSHTTTSLKYTLSLRGPPAC